jgi:hypothetical protein
VALQFDGHGNRIWRDAKAVLDSEHTRRAVGEVVVRSGYAPNRPTCKPGACLPIPVPLSRLRPFPHRRLYLPDLHTYLVS